MNGLGIPKILDEILSYFHKQQILLQEKGIFRKSGMVQEIEELSDLLDEGKYEALEVVTDNNVIACVLKNFFSKMDGAIFNEGLYKQIVNYNSKLS